jgi:hypothetical protein
MKSWGIPPNNAFFLISRKSVVLELKVQFARGKYLVGN